MRNIAALKTEKMKNSFAYTYFFYFYYNSRSGA